MQKNFQSIQTIKNPIQNCTLKDLNNANEYILVVNPGSTSTKIGLGVYLQNKLHLYETTLEVDEKIKDYTIGANLIESKINYFLKTNHLDKNKIISVCGRGGILKPNQGGLIQVNQKDKQGNYTIVQSIEHDLINKPQLQHESNMGAIIASSIASKLKKPAYILDPVTSDVNSEFNKYSGKRGFERRSIYHALNIKAVLRSFSNHIHKELNSINSVLIHIGGGITIASCKNGEIIDTTNALVGEGPMTVKRGIIQAADMIKFAVSEYKKGHTLENIILKEFASNAGMNSYLQTDSLIEIEKNIKIANELKQKYNLLEDDKPFTLLNENDMRTLLNEDFFNNKNKNIADVNQLIKEFALSIQSNYSNIELEDLFKIIMGELGYKVIGIMAYQIAGFIGNYAVKIKSSKLDGIIFTGGGANSKILLEFIQEYLQILNTKFFVLPNSLEQWSMLEQTFATLNNTVSVSQYESIDKTPQENIFNIDYTSVNIQMPSPRVVHPIKNMQNLLDHAKDIGRKKPISLAIVKANDSSKKASQIGLDENIISNVIHVDQVEDAIDLFKQEKVQLIMKGADKTSDFLKPIMKLKLPFYEKITYATVTMVNINGVDRLIISSDAGITTGIDEFALVDMIKNVSYLAKSLGMKPKVALLSAAEKATPRINLSVASEEISKLNWDFIVDGPISYDIAMCEKTALNKKYEGKIQGDANVLIHMDIISANVYYKHLLLSEKKSINNYFANAVIGLPAVLASREAPKEEKLLTLALSIILSEVNN